MRLVVMFDNFGPYHLARLQAVRRQAEQEGFEVLGLETLGASPKYSWTSLGHPVMADIITLFPRVNQRRPPIPLLGYSVVKSLTALRPDAVAICGYGEAVPLAALAWTKAKGKIAVLMSDSSYRDKERYRLLERSKSLIVRHFDAALVAGGRQKEYAKFLGLPEERIFLGYDVVDNAYFAERAAAVRRQARKCRQCLGLLKPFFLTVCRFIPKKNLALLIEAYRHYRDLAGAGAWDLVLCGSGPLEHALQRQARDLQGVHFPGFKQIDELPEYYGLASAFILPSSHYEQWGLVVNEAMASGLPVLVSSACGCVPDLVPEGVNGFTFDPWDGEGLAQLMLKMSSREVDLKAMGEASGRIIADWSPEVFARNLFRAVNAAADHRKGN
jgi:1,2-diacylglycerol 3-alpha-glucosyltransferase